MKKYNSPQIERIQLSLSTTISNCEGDNQYYEMLQKDYGLFTDQDALCTTIVPDGELLPDGHCYHTSANAVFTS